MHTESAQGGSDCTPKGYAAVSDYVDRQIAKNGEVGALCAPGGREEIH